MLYPFAVLIIYIITYTQLLHLDKTFSVSEMIVWPWHYDNTLNALHYLKVIKNTPEDGVLNGYYSDNH